MTNKNLKKRIEKVNELLHLEDVESILEHEVEEIIYNLKNKYPYVDNNFEEIALELLILDRIIERRDILLESVYDEDDYDYDNDYYDDYHDYLTRCVDQIVGNGFVRNYDLELKTISSINNQYHDYINYYQSTDPKSVKEVIKKLSLEYPNLYNYKVTDIPLIKVIDDSFINKGDWEKRHNYGNVRYLYRSNKVENILSLSVDSSYVYDFLLFYIPDSDYPFELESSLGNTIIGTEFYKYVDGQSIGDIYAQAHIITLLNQLIADNYIEIGGIEPRKVESKAYISVDVLGEVYGMDMIAYGQKLVKELLENCGKKQFSQWGYSNIDPSEIKSKIHLTSNKLSVLRDVNNNIYYYNYNDEPNTPFLVYQVIGSSHSDKVIHSVEFATMELINTYNIDEIK